MLPCGNKKTAEDFLELKALSDETYHQQVIDKNRTSQH